MTAVELDDEVRNQVYEFILGRVSLEGFEDWFVGSTWNDRTDLIAMIDHLLAERDLISEEQLHRELARAVSLIRRTEGTEEPVTRTWSSSNTNKVWAASSLLGGTTTIRGRLALASR